MDNLGKYVLTINENRSLTKAAKVLGISQPALSAALNSVEKKLGYQIFDRKKSPIAPTREGEVYISYLKELMVLDADLDKKISDIQAGSEKSITVGAPATYLDSILLKAVERFCNECKDCRIKVVESTVPELVKKTQDNIVDLFISTSSSLPEEFNLEQLTPERIYLCIPAQWDINKSISDYKIEYENNTEISITLPVSVIKDMNFIFLEDGQPLQIGVNKFLKKNGITPKSYIEVDQVKTALSLALAGCGICFASSSVLSNCHELDKICIYPLDDSSFKRDIYVAYSGINYLSKNGEHFLNILRDINKGE